MNDRVAKESEYVKPNSYWLTAENADSIAVIRDSLGKNKHQLCDIPGNSKLSDQLEMFFDALMTCRLAVDTDQHEGLRQYANQLADSLTQSNRYICDKKIRQIVYSVDCAIGSVVNGGMHIE